MSKPQPKTAFLLVDPQVVAPTFIIADLFTSNETLIDLARNFSGIIDCDPLGKTCHRLRFDPTYDYQEVWLMLYDALEHEAKFSETWANAFDDEMQEGEG